MSTVATTKKYLTPPEAAELLGVSHVNILRFINKGELRAIDLSSIRGNRPRWHISRDDLNAFLDRRAASPPSQPKRRGRPPKQSEPDYEEFYPEK